MHQVLLVYQCGLFICAQIYKRASNKQKVISVCLVSSSIPSQRRDILERMKELEEKKKSTVLLWTASAKLRVDCKLKIFKHALWLREQAHHNYKYQSHISIAVPSQLVTWLYECLAWLQSHQSVRGQWGYWMTGNSSEIFFCFFSTYFRAAASSFKRSHFERNYVHHLYPGIRMSIIFSF